MTAVVFTLGCKVNDVESGSIIRGLQDLGYKVARELCKADVYIFNTCAVTAEAERKSRQAIGKALKLNQNAKIIVCGCAGEKNPSAFLGKSKNVVAVVGAKAKNKVLEIISSGFKPKLLGDQRTEECKIYEEMPLPDCLKTRNFVKIQDGCNRFCSYCVIPYLRGRSRSRRLENAVEEILRSDAFETVITGIDISAYKDEQGRDLADLMLAVQDAKSRIRLGSMEVSLITPKFLNALKQVKNFAPHFHLSLQSGSNTVLKSMNRHYTKEDYLEKCKMIYEAFPNASITTDIIAGFPTETEEDFLQSLQIVAQAGFLQIHAFPYSPREGTNSFKKYKELPFQLKKERCDRLIEQGKREKEKYIQRFLNQILTVVPEQYEEGYTQGYTENYIRVYVKGKIANFPQKVKLEKLYKDGAIASLIE